MQVGFKSGFHCVSEEKAKIKLSEKNRGFPFAFEYTVKKRHLSKHFKYMEKVQFNYTNSSVWVNFSTAYTKNQGIQDFPEGKLRSRPAVKTKILHTSRQKKKKKNQWTQYHIHYLVDT